MRVEFEPTGNKHDYCVQTWGHALVGVKWDDVEKVHSGFFFCQRGVPRAGDVIETSGGWIYLFEVEWRMNPWDMYRFKGKVMTEHAKELWVEKTSG